MVNQFNLYFFQEYILPDVKDRQYLITMHKRAKKVGLDLERYNIIKEQIYGIEYDLRRLRDPLQVSFCLQFLKNFQKQLLSKKGGL